MPLDPGRSPFVFDVAGMAPGAEVLGVGADLAPATLLAAYRCGAFPMGLGEGGAAPMGWWSPDPRGVLLPGDLIVHRSLRRARRDFEVTVDRDFAAVMAGCANGRRDGDWITPQIEAAYGHLHELGWAHSIEVWPAGRVGVELVGGLYGVAIGGLFAGESMFHRTTDASKVALMGLVETLGTEPDTVIDVQWRTDHLASLGVIELPRTAYLRRLARAIERPLPEIWR